MRTSPTPFFNLPEGKLHLFALLAFTLLGAYLRLFNLSQNPVWGDEGMTAFFSSLPYRTLWTIPLEPHPPLYYSLVRMVFEHGDGEGALRLVSAISGALAIPIVYAIGRVCVTPSVGLLAALVLSVSNVHIEYSQEARSYALLTTVFAITVLFTALYCRSFSRNSKHYQNTFYVVGFFIFSIIGYFTHMIFIYYSFTAVLVGLFELICEHKGEFRLWRWPDPPWLYIFASLSAALVWAGLYLWLSAGGIENARILLLSNTQISGGIGNQNDLVGRYFADHVWYNSGYILPFDQNPSVAALYEGEHHFG